MCEERGGFGRIRSQGSEEAIRVRNHYRKESRSAPPITYELTIDLDDKRVGPSLCMNLCYQYAMWNRPDGESSLVLG